MIIISMAPGQATIIISGVVGAVKLFRALHSLERGYFVVAKRIMDSTGGELNGYSSVIGGNKDAHSQCGGVLEPELDGQSTSVGGQ